MKTQLTAQEAIDKVKNEKTTFLQTEVNKNNHAWEIRQALQGMAEAGKLSPGEFKKAMDITFTSMSEREKEIDAYKAENE
jgi:hypothetical protein